MASHASDTALPEHFPPRAFRILGAGRFGTIAARRLGRRFPEADFLVIDTREDRLQKIERELGLPVRTAGTIPYLEESQPADDVWLVPAVPVHVAFLWMLSQLNSMGGVRARSIAVPESVDTQVPNALRAPDGTVYASFATFICPDACDEPDGICTYTGKAREGNLFESIGRVTVPEMEVVVVRSWQLAPGVGGYLAGVLRERLHRVSAKEGRYLVATSCRCHGVLNALEWDRER